MVGWWGGGWAAVEQVCGRAADSVSKLSGAEVHGPSKPERSAWQRPSVCAPESATMSSSSKPIR